MFDLDFMGDYTMFAVVAVVLLIAGGYYYYSRSKKAVSVSFDLSTNEADCESVSSKDDYVCDGDKCFKKE